MPSRRHLTTAKTHTSNTFALALSVAAAVRHGVRAEGDASGFAPGQGRRWLLGRIVALTVFDQRIPLWIIWNDNLVGEALAFIALTKNRFTLRSCIPIGIGAAAAPDHVGVVPELAG